MKKRIIAAAENLGLTFGLSRFAGNPRWECCGRFLMGAESLADVLGWAHEISGNPAFLKLQARAERAGL